MSWEKILKEDEPLDDERIQFLLDAIRSLEIAKKLFEEDPNYNKSKETQVLIPDIIDSIERAKEELS
tara:strand:- start:103 stop:303 length:201 start_codon:yes stop_codon:yes gene_type:complete